LSEELALISVFLLFSTILNLFSANVTAQFPAAWKELKPAQTNAVKQVIFNPAISPG
jgi:hypothetical protein